MRVFRKCKLKKLMLEAGVTKYQELAELSKYSVATIRKARRTGVPDDTAKFIVLKLLEKMRESTRKKLYDDKSEDEVLDEVTIPVSPASCC